MARINNAEALRQWLRGCPWIARESAFDVDWLGDGTGGFALSAAPSQPEYRENILGRKAPPAKQGREFWLDARLPHGADVAQNLSNLGFLQRVEHWILAQNAAGAFPEWEGGRVTAILPALTGAPEDVGSGWARYRMKLRVEYEASETTI